MLLPSAKTYFFIHNQRYAFGRPALRATMFFAGKIVLYLWWRFLPFTGHCKKHSASRSWRQQHIPPNRWMSFKTNANSI